MADQNLEKKIAEQAALPKSYENDGEKITNHSLTEIIEADKYLSRRRACRNPFGALKIVKISTQGPGK